MILAAFFIIYWLQVKWGILSRALYATFAYTLWFYSFANILNTIPSGGRFLSVAQLLSLFIIIIFFQNYYRRLFARFLFPVFLPLPLMTLLSN